MPDYRQKLSYLTFRYKFIKQNTFQIEFEGLNEMQYYVLQQCQFTETFLSYLTKLASLQ